MSEQIRCPNCGQTYELTAEQAPQYAGQTITCTQCQRPFTVPTHIGGAAASVAPPAHAPPPGVTPGGGYAMPGAGGGGVGYPPGAPAGGGIGYPPGAGGAGGATPYGGYAGGYAPPPGPVSRETSGLAITALVCGIIGLIIPILPGLVAIVTGALALRETKDPRVGGRGLAIAGLVLGCASFLCMGAVLLPSLNRARETANRIKCASNMRQIGQALLLYSNENRGQYPPDLAALLTTQDIAADAFVCPSSKDTPAPAGTPQQQAAALDRHCSYTYVPGLSNMAGAAHVALHEPLTNHRNDGANFLFGDGHVSFESKQQAQSMINEVAAGQNPPPSGGP